MATEEEVVILTRLAGTREFIANAEASGAAVRELGLETEFAGTAMEHTRRRGFLMNQALFTVRRLTYFTTLAFLASGVAALKWGFDFNSAMQQARVALRPVANDIGGVQRELDYLFNFTKYTPFQFKDVTIAFRQMYLGMHTAGIGANLVNQTLKAIVDALAAAGRTSPGALNRVSVALQHMAYMGRLTGQVVLQLARDGLPIYAALRTELGLTADQMHHVGQLGIPSIVALRALNKYIETYPGTANAAYRLATQSLHGQFTTFKDNLSQLMGAVETGFFRRMQSRITDMNNWFSRFSSTVRHGNMDQIIGTISPQALPLWHQLTADITLLWRIFTGIIRDVFRSKVVWAGVFAVLVLLHGILIPINYAVQHMGWLLSILIPLWVTYRTVQILATVATKTATFWEIAQFSAIKDMTFAQFLLNMSLRAYYLLQRLIITTTMRAAAAQGIWTVATRGYVRGAGGQFRAMTSLEKMVLRMRRFVLALIAPILTAATATWTWTAALLANPITWIVLGVIALSAGLVVLYLKWKPFHDAVNETVGFLYSHPLVALFTPVIGPLIMIARLFAEIYAHVRQIYDFLQHPVRHAQHVNKFNAVKHGIQAGSIFSLFLGGIPGAQAGGHVISSGLAMVGERGPELLRLPRGASVLPLENPAVNLSAFGRGSSDRQPLVVQLVVGKKVLAEAVAEVQLNAAARA